MIKYHQQFYKNAQVFLSVYINLGKSVQILSANLIDIRLVFFVF